MCVGVGGMKGLAPQHLEPGISLGRWAKGNLCQCLKEAQDVGTNSPGDCLCLEVATEKGVPRLLRTGFPPRACKERTSSDPFLGQWLSGV